MTRIQPVNKSFYLFTESVRHGHPGTRSGTEFLGLKLNIVRIL